MPFRRKEIGDLVAVLMKFLFDSCVAEVERRHLRSEIFVGFTKAILQVDECWSPVSERLKVSVTVLLLQFSEVIMDPSDAIFVCVSVSITETFFDSPFCTDPSYDK